jgi:sugar/nucleoside kinase (ribokinase family)
VSSEPTLVAAPAPVPPPTEGPQDDVWIVGHLTVDDVVLPDGRTVMGTVGGAAIYAAVGAHLVGSSAGIISRMGCDYPPVAADRLVDSGIGARLTPVAGRALAQWAIYEHDGSRTYVLHPSSGDYADTSPVPDDGVDWPGIRGLHLAPMPIRYQSRWVEAAQEHGVEYLTLDPHHDSSADDAEGVLATLPFLHAFLPSELESTRLHGRDPYAAVQAFVEQGAPIAVVKLGPEGSLLATDEGMWHLSACEVEAVDTTGAGDAFAGGFLAALVRGDRPLDAARLGTVAAGLTIGQSGALTPTWPTPEGRLSDLLATVTVTRCT